MTHLCVSIFVTDLAKAKRDITTAAEAGADMVELRVDGFSDGTLLESLIREAIMPVIVTCRPEWEGGHSQLGDVERSSILTHAADAGAHYVDLELATARRRPSELRHAVAGRINSRTKLILSTHHFTSRPSRLSNLVVELNQSLADIAKIVWLARTIRDNLEAFEILQTRVKPTIALCMGEAGLISRVLAKKFGGFLTFASLSTDSATAPGQISIHDLKHLYRWDAIQPTTRVYGVVGSPIMHSMSPAIHNAAFAETGIDAVYLPLLVNPGYESFKAFMESFLHFPALDLSGLSITIPHKENALRYLTDQGAVIEPLARRIGAVNTIAIDRSGDALKLSGINTDYAAILDSITTRLNITREQLADYRVAVIGAGGTGRTAVAALAHYGATVVIYNRTFERAQALAAEFTGQSGQVVAARLEKLCDSCCHIYLNTTSVGMHPHIDASPLGDSAPKFTKDTLVFDTIYNPLQTKLLTQAQAAGAQTISGLEMFLRQAAAQFQLWTDTPAPLDTMRRVLESSLSPQP